MRKVVRVVCAHKRECVHVCLGSSSVQALIVGFGIGFNYFRIGTNGGLCERGNQHYGLLK
jgi:hypothetical protein